VKLGLAIHEVVEAEGDLAEQLLHVGERHRTDHDVYHLTRLLSRWAQGHLAALAPFAAEHDETVDTADVGRETAGALSALREKTAELLGRRPESGLLLLHDLRELHLQAARASLAWTVLGQGAQAAKQQELLNCVSLCHPETLRTLRWTVTKLKESAPHILTT
jgi:predicted RNA-binding Zn ribbon-like protein